LRERVTVELERFVRMPTATTPLHRQGRDAVVVDRPPPAARLAVSAAWLAYMAGAIAGGGAMSVQSAVNAAVLGAIYVLLGFAAASRTRTLIPDRSHGRLALLTLAVGTSLGLFNLGANWAIAQIRPTLRALLVQRFSDIGVIESVLAAPLLEEVTVRLFVMSAIAWVVFRICKRATLAFGLALLTSALFFAALHLFRPLPLDPALVTYYRIALMAKYTVAGAVLGSVFWRWGLPYAILTHALVNATHTVLEPFVFR
jgi:Type II CAAX prenyl endopeptidase Rce1-like